MKKNIFIGLICGGIAGIIDVTPMIIQNLTWDANLGAFSMWIIVGFFLATTRISINPILRGMLFAFLVLLPSSFIIGWHEPVSLIPISTMTLILGGLLGFTINKFTIKFRE